MKTRYLPYATSSFSLAILFSLFNVPGDEVIKYVFTVKAGEPKYLGVVTIEETQTLKRSVAFGLKENSGAEKEAWEKFSSLYPQSAWTSAVQKRISELK